MFFVDWLVQNSLFEGYLTLISRGDSRSAKLSATDLWVSNF